MRLRRRHLDAHPPTNDPGTGAPPARDAIFQEQLTAIATRENAEDRAATLRGPTNQLGAAIQDARASVSGRTESASR